MRLNQGDWLLRKSARISAHTTLPPTPRGKYQFHRVLMRGRTSRLATRRNIKALVLRLARENPDYVDPGIMWSLAAD